MQALYVKGHVTPARFYAEAYRHRGRPIILDDAEGLLRKDDGLEIVNALGDTTRERVVCWGTSAARSLGEGVPASFVTTSPLCVISNQVTTHAALQSRALTLYFDPPNLEVHRTTARWFWDQEIFDFVGDHIDGLRPLEMRWYVMAEADKRNGRDWRRLFREDHAHEPVIELVRAIEADPRWPTRRDKERAFLEQMGGVRGASASSYARIVSNLKRAGKLRPCPAPRMRLARLARARPMTAEEAELAGATPPRQEERPPSGGHTPIAEAPVTAEPGEIGLSDDTAAIDLVRRHTPSPPPAVDDEDGE